MPGTYDLVIQVSRGGAGDADFAPLSTIAEVTPGDPFSVVDSPIPPGQLRLYRARYVCRTNAAIFSTWAYAISRGPYPAGEASMGDVTTSAVSALAVSNPERTPGNHCKVGYYLDFITHSITAQRGVSESSANRNSVAGISDQGPAITRVAGSASLDFRPAGGFLRLLLTAYFLQQASVSTIASVVGPPAIPQHYKQKLVLSNKKRPISAVSKEGDYAFAYAGVQLGRLRYSADKIQTTKIRADVELVALNALTYAAETSNDLAMLGLDTAGYDLMTALNPTDWVVYINGVAASCTSHNVDFDFGINTKDVGNNHMGASAHFALKSSVTGSLNLYFESLDEFKAFWGHDAAKLLPFGVSKTIKYKEVKVVYTPPTNEDNYSNEVALVLPKCSFRSLTKEIPENGAIVQQIDFQPIQDPTQGRIDHYWEFTNGESYANLTDYAQEVGYAPKQDLFPNYAIPGLVNAAPAPTTTVFATQATYLGEGYLSAVDDVYNGKTIRFITGANAGQARTISDYVGASRTFTLSVALPQAPATGDAFQILNAEKA